MRSKIISNISYDIISMIISLNEIYLLYPNPLVHPHEN